MRPKLSRAPLSFRYPQISSQESWVLGCPLSCHSQMFLWCSLYIEPLWYVPTLCSPPRTFGRYRVRLQLHTLNLLLILIRLNWGGSWIMLRDSNLASSDMPLSLHMHQAQLCPIAMEAPWSLGSNENWTTFSIMPLTVYYYIPTTLLAPVILFYSATSA